MAGRGRGGKCGGGAAFMASMTAALGRPLKSMQIGQIPRNALGKIERATLRALTLAQAPVET